MINYIGKIYTSMKKTIRFFLVCVTLAAMVGVGCYVYNREYVRAATDDIRATDVDLNVFRPYIPGTTISFARGGNSADYVRTTDGWGGQEDEHRCTVGKSTIVRMYIPDATDSYLQLVVDAFGVYPAKFTTYQQITVFANDTEIAVWRVGSDGPFVVDIPSSIITDNTLTLRFDAARPYSPPGDRRKLGMAVRSIKIDRIFAGHTKQKIGRWIKKNIMDGGIRQEYDTSTSGSNDVWM